MKKLFSAFLVAIVACSMICLCVHAEGANKLEGVDWVKGYCNSIETYDDNGTKIYKANYKEGAQVAWGSPTIPILNAVKAVIGEDDTADVVIAFSVRAVGPNPDETVTTGCRALIRGESSIKNKEEFDEKYEVALDGSDPFFVMSNGNIQKGDKSYTISNQEWTDIEIVIEGLENAQVNNDVVTGWNLCIDNIKNCSELAGLEFKNTGVYLMDEYEPAEGSDSELADKPEENEVANGAVATQSPARTAEPAADSEQTPVKAASSFSINTVFYIVGGVLIVASVALVVASLVKKPKKEDVKAEDKAE